MREIIKKSIDHYNSTGDISHLVDVVRIYEYRTMGPIERFVRVNLKEFKHSFKDCLREVIDYVGY